MEKIIGIINNANAITVIGFIVSIFGAYITSKITANNATKNITTQYFKEEGIAIQKGILCFWSSLLVYDFNIEAAFKNAFPSEEIYGHDEVEMVKNITQKSYMVCSKKSIKAFRYYMDYIKDKTLIEQTISSANLSKKRIGLIKKIQNMYGTCAQIVLVSRIITRLKYDFNGERLDELDLIRIKINDFGFKYRMIKLLVNIKYFILEHLKEIVMLLFIGLGLVVLLIN